LPSKIRMCIDPKIIIYRTQTYQICRPIHIRTRVFRLGSRPAAKHGELPKSMFLSGLPYAPCFNTYIPSCMLFKRCKYARNVFKKLSYCLIFVYVVFKNLVGTWTIIFSCVFFSELWFETVVMCGWRCIWRNLSFFPLAPKLHPTRWSISIHYCFIEICFCLIFLLSILPLFNKLFQLALGYYDWSIKWFMLCVHASDVFNNFVMRFGF